MHVLDAFAEFTKRHEPLAPYTYLRLGGPAEFLVQPRSREELASVAKACMREAIPLRVLGNGCNLLIREEGISGAVVRLVEPAFTQIQVQGRRVRSGAGAALSALISHAARHGLAGLEALVGIPGTVGGALRCNAGDRTAEIGQFVHQVEVFDSQGERQVRERDELRFGPGWSNLDDPVLVETELELESDQEAAIVKRMRRAWIQRKAGQPLGFQHAARLFKNPRGTQASSLIVQAGLGGSKVGGAQLSDRDANYVIAEKGATSLDVHRLIDLVRTRVQERTGTQLELDLMIW